MHKNHAKAQEYRRFATEAAAMAVASSLNQVREKHHIAALRWAALAATEEERRLPALAL
jgi:hypothetical protein